MDITEVILTDHEEQRRMFARLDDVDRSDTDTLGKLWTRLSTMLEVHAQAEEEFFYPELLKLQFVAYEAEHVTGVPIVDKDPDQYVKDNS